MCEKQTAFATIATDGKGLNAQQADTAHLQSGPAARPVVDDALACDQWDVLPEGIRRGGAAAESATTLL